MKNLSITLKLTALPACLALGCAIAISIFPPKAAALSERFPSRAAVESDRASGDSPPATRSVKIQIVETDTDRKTKEVAWLGVSTEETSEVVAAQLGLEPGDGLVIKFVEPDSPAAKAGLQQNDVLFQLGDQLLVHPGQFRKLVRRQKEGDQIKLTLYRSGKKETV